jgi:hypothetical protein
MSILHAMYEPDFNAVCHPHQEWDGQRPGVSSHPEYFLLQFHGKDWNPHGRFAGCVLLSSWEVMMKRKYTTELSAQPSAIGN